MSIFSSRFEEKNAHFEKEVPNFGEKDRFFLTIFCSVTIMIIGKACFVLNYIWHIENKLLLLNKLMTQVLDDPSFTKMIKLPV